LVLLAIIEYGNRVIKSVNIHHWAIVNVEGHSSRNMNKTFIRIILIAY